MELVERVTAASQALENAKNNLATTKSAAGVEHKDDAMANSEDDMDKDIAGQTSQRIQEGISNLHHSLKQLQSQADQMVEDEQKALKRPRIATPTEAGTEPGTNDGKIFP